MQFVEKLAWVLLFLYLVAFPFGQLLKISLGFTNVHVADIIVGLIAITWVVQKNKTLPPMWRGMVCFFVAFTFSFLFAAHDFYNQELLVGGLYLLRLISYGLFYFVVWNLVKGREFRVLLRSSLIVVGIVVAVLGWAQYFSFPDIRPFAVWGWDEHYLRLVGTFLDPGFTSIILVFLVILLFSTFVPTDVVKYRGAKLFHPPGGIVVTPRVLLLCMVFGALLFTYSRAGYISFLAAMATISILRKNIVFILGAILFMGIGVLVLPQNTSEGTTLSRTTSSFARFENWGNAIKIWETSPVFGVGFNNYQFALSRLGVSNGDNSIPNHGATGSDSSLLFVLATGGIVGFLLFAHFALNLVTLVWGQKGSMVEAFLASFVALSTHSIFTNSLFYPAVMGWMAILFALTMRETKESM